MATFNLLTWFHFFTPLILNFLIIKTKNFELLQPCDSEGVEKHISTWNEIFPDVPSIDLATITVTAFLLWLLVQNVLLIELSHVGVSKSEEPEDCLVLLDNYFQNFCLHDDVPIIVVSNIWAQDRHEEDVLENLVVHVVVMTSSDVEHAVVNENSIRKYRSWLKCVKWVIYRIRFLLSGYKQAPSQYKQKNQNLDFARE